MTRTAFFLTPEGIVVALKEYDTRARIYRILIAGGEVCQEVVSSWLPVQQAREHIKQKCQQEGWRNATIEEIVGNGQQAVIA